MFDIKTRVFNPKMTKTILVATLILIAAQPLTASDAERSFHDVPAGAKLVLPEATTAGWLIPPGMLAKLKASGFLFDVAPNGKVCLAKGRIIFYPELILTLTTKVPIQEFTWLAQGNMLVRSGQSLGFLNIDPDEVYGVTEKSVGGKGNVSFSSRFTLPYKQSHLYGGLGDHFYVVGYNEKAKRNEISVWDLSDEKVPARPLYATDSPINAVAGSPQKTYFASGPEIFVLEKGSTTPKSIYVHAREDIRELTYRPDVGLFFTTDHSAGYIGAKESYEFLAYPGVQLRLRGNALYIRFGAVGNGIMRITGPAHFADVRLDPPK